MNLQFYLNLLLILNIVSLKVIAQTIPKNAEATAEKILSTIFTNLDEYKHSRNQSTMDMINKHNRNLKDLETISLKNEQIVKAEAQSNLDKIKNNRQIDDVRDDSSELVEMVEKFMNSLLRIFKCEPNIYSRDKVSDSYSFAYRISNIKEIYKMFHNISLKVIRKSSQCQNVSEALLEYNVPKDEGDEPVVPVLKKSMKSLYVIFYTFYEQLNRPMLIAKEINCSENNNAKATTKGNLKTTKKSKNETKQNTKNDDLPQNRKTTTKKQNKSSTILSTICKHTTQLPATTVTPKKCKHNEASTSLPTTTTASTTSTHRSNSSHSCKRNGTSTSTVDQKQTTTSSVLPTKTRFYETTIPVSTKRTRTTYPSGKNENLKSSTVQATTAKCNHSKSTSASSIKPTTITTSLEKCKHNRSSTVLPATTKSSIIPTIVKTSTILSTTSKISTISPIPEKLQSTKVCNHNKTNSQEPEQTRTNLPTTSSTRKPEKLQEEPKQKAMEICLNLPCGTFVTYNPPVHCNLPTKHWFSAGKYWDGSDSYIGTGYAMDGTLGYGELNTPGRINNKKLSPGIFMELHGEEVFDNSSVTILLGHPRLKWKIYKWKQDFVIPKNAVKVSTNMEIKLFGRFNTSGSVNIGKVSPSWGFTFMINGTQRWEKKFELLVCE